MKRLIITLLTLAFGGGCTMTKTGCATTPVLDTVVKMEVHPTKFVRFDGNDNGEFDRGDRACMYVIDGRGEDLLMGCASFEEIEAELRIQMQEQLEDLRDQMEKQFEGEDFNEPIIPEEKCCQESTIKKLNGKMTSPRTCKALLQVQQLVKSNTDHLNLPLTDS